MGAPASETSSFGFSRIHAGAERIAPNRAAYGPGCASFILIRYAPAPIRRARLPAIVIPPGSAGVSCARSVTTSP